MQNRLWCDSVAFCQHAHKKQYPHHEEFEGAVKVLTATAYIFQEDQ